MNETVPLIEALLRRNSTNGNINNDERAIMILINISVITLGSLGIILNGFSLHVLWKCTTTGQLGIKLVLLSDLLVCIAYVAFNIQSNIVNSLSNYFNKTYVVRLATINRLSIHVSLFVSNWWIIALLLLRILTIFSSVHAKYWDKMLYHRLIYASCWIAGIAIVVPLRFHDRYVRLVIYVVPVVLVSIEAALIIYGIKRVQGSPAKRSSTNSYLEIPCSSSNNSSHVKARQTNFQTVATHKPYNNIVLTILLLALNFLILDSLLFIDTLYAISKFRNEPLPMWFILLINIFSLMKRILNFVILCAKCRYFRKIMNIKLSIMSRHLQIRHKLKTRKLSNPVFQNQHQFSNHCADCQRPALFAMDNDFVSKTNLIERIMETSPFPISKMPMFKLGSDSLSGQNTYFSAFEMSPGMHGNPTRLITSARY